MIGPRPDVVLELLSQVRLTDLDQILAARPHELSGGQKQRVMIALALASRPKLLLADEPTSALDATVQREIMDLLGDIRRDRGLTILMVTHDMPMALALSDRVSVMSDGEIVDTFNPRPLILTRPARPHGNCWKAWAMLSVRSTRKPNRAPVVLRTERLTKTWNSTKTSRPCTDLYSRSARHHPSYCR